MSNNAYMFIATEPLGPVWSQTGSDGKLQNQNDAWHSWLASNYVWIPSYIAYGLVDMVPWQDTVAPIADISLKPCQSQMSPSKGKGIKGMESSKRHEGKNSLAPDELLGAELAHFSQDCFLYNCQCGEAASVRTRGKNFIKICYGSLRCIWQRSQTPRLIQTRPCKNSTCSRTGLLAAVQGTGVGLFSKFFQSTGAREARETGRALARMH